MKNFIQPGDCMTFTAPGGGVVAGKGCKIGQLFVVPTTDTAAGLPFSGCVTGVFDLDKVSAQAWTEGALIYWDNAAKNCTTVSTSNLLIGAAAAVAANPSATGLVRLNGVGRPSEA